MTPEQSTAALTILDFWQAIEALSPAAPPKNDRKGHVWTAGDETTLPWHERMRATYAETRERRWRFQVHIGLFEMEGVVLELRERLGVDDDEERPRGGEAALVCLCVTADGHPFGVPAVSAAPWAMNEIAVAQGDLRFGDFGAVEERVVTRVTDYLAEREILTPEGAGGGETVGARPLTLADCDAIAAIVATETGWAPRAGFTARARFKGVELKRRKDGRFGEIEPDLLNSFVLRDLGRVSGAIGRGDHGPGLARYLFGHDGARTDVVRDPGFAERTLRPSNLPPGCWPTPGGHPLVMAQQMAVNAALGALKDDRGVFSVNGPPGTGKTTLLRDLIVGVIVERATALAQFAQPNDAFGDRRPIRHSDYHVWEIDERLRGFEMVVASSNNSAVENVTRELPALKAIDPRWLDQADHFRAAADTLFAPEDNPGKTGACWGMMAAVLGNKEKRSAFVNRFWFGRFDRVKVPPTLFKNAFQDGAPSWAEARAAFRQAIARFEARRDALAAMSDALAEQDAALAALSAAADAARRDEDVERRRAFDAGAAREELAKASAWVEVLDRCQDAAERERASRDAVSRLDALLKESGQSETALTMELAEAEAAVAACDARLPVERELYERLDRERPSFFSKLFGTKLQRDWLARRLEAGDAVTRIQRERVEADLRRLKGRAALESLRRERASAPAERDRALTDREAARRTLAELLRSSAALAEPALLQEAGDWQGVGGALRGVAATAAADVRALTDEARRKGAELDEARRRLAASRAAWAQRRSACEALESRIGGLSGGFAGTRINAAWRALSEEERQTTSPWVDAELHDLRVACFLRALDLHRAFLAGASKKVWTNLNQFMDLLSGKISGDAIEGGPASLWATFGLAVPLVSTTFASFDRLFDGMGRESIGWLFVDEAGQATPQAATGAVWRARRAVIIGDPLQLEPVVTLPPQAVEAIRRRCALADRWHPVRASAQVLADRANPLGTALPREDGDPLWVGSPLRVHRRCLDPMFSVANRIAYDGLMVQGRVDALDPGGLFGESRWIDVPAEGAEGHLIPAQRDLACALVVAAWNAGKRAGGKPPNLYVITPFRKVAQGLRQRLERERLDPDWIKASVGTVHTFQGKEAELVLLVLGGDPAKPGGMDWAALAPNLLNVALTRARDRILVIGDRDRWKTRRHFDALASSLPIVNEASIRAEIAEARLIGHENGELVSG